MRLSVVSLSGTPPRAVRVARGVGASPAPRVGDSVAGPREAVSRFAPSKDFTIVVKLRCADPSLREPWHVRHEVDMMRKTKIVATVGPACESEDQLKALALAGVNVFRLNFSHGTNDNKRAVTERINRLNEELGSHIAILADLQGPKIRLRDVEEGAVLTPGDSFELTTDVVVGNGSRASITYDSFARDVKEGERILLDDGKLVVEVLSSNGVDTVKTRVIYGGPLKSKKGVNLPNTLISLPSLTDKDREDLDVAISLNVSWIGLSFVRQATDVHELKSILKERGSEARVCAKIEKPEAIDDIDGIIDATDAIMVARGDLGVEIPIQEVPVLQKRIVDKCRQTCTPVIIATQMMESMIESQSPTRAEVNDVATAVMDSADAVMLSGETSVGAYPARVVEVMHKIIDSVEATYPVPVRSRQSPGLEHRKVTDSICVNAASLADAVDARGILCMTQSGYAARIISSCRSKADIFAFTANRRILNTLSLLRGVRAFYYDGYESTDATITDIQTMLKEGGYLSEGARVVITASMPISAKGMTNALKVSTVD